MRIQPISIKMNSNRYNSVNHKQSNIQTSPVSFKGNFEQIMRNVLSRDITSRAEVEHAMSELYFASVGENGISKTSIYPLLSGWLAVKGTFLIEELCKPIAKVRSEFRDIIFDSQEKCLPIVQKEDKDLIYIANFGKQGFWNNMFENESAPNDVRVIFASNEGTFEVGTNKKEKLVTEQYWKSGYWKKNVYNWYFGDRISHKTGDASETIIWPPSI